MGKNPMGVKDKAEQWSEIATVDNKLYTILETGSALCLVSPVCPSSADMGT